MYLNLHLEFPLLMTHRCPLHFKGGHRPDELILDLLQLGLSLDEIHQGLIACSQLCLQAI